MTPSLSKESEDRLVSALEEVAGLVETGSSPNDAICKVAADKQIPRGHISLMTYAYNTGRTESQRKTSDDVLDKAGGFEMADDKKILGKLYPESTKTAAEIRQRREIDPSYSRPPEFLEKRALQELRERVEQIDWTMVPAPPPVLPNLPGRLAEKAAGEIDRGRRLVEESRSQTQYAFDRMTEAVDTLASFMKRADAPSFCDVRDNASRLYGDPAVKLFNYLEKTHSVLSKQASAGNLVPVEASRPPYSMIAETLRLAESFCRADEEHQKLAEKKYIREAELRAPFSPPPFTVQTVLGSYEPDEAQKQAFLGAMGGTMVGTAMGREMANQIAGSSIDVLKQKMQNKLTDPQHEMSLRNLQTESMLNDLMANDEVISGYQAPEVLRHFNEISQLAPRASNQSGIIRALLRKRLQQGASDPYEIESLLKIENGLRSRDGMGSPQGVMQDGSSVLS